MTTEIRNPGLSSDEPRQLAFELLKAMGMTVLLTSPYPAEYVLAEALRVAPTLGRSSHLNRAVMRLDADPATMWMTVESPTGSAILVFGSPESDTNLIMTQIMQPFESTASPFARAIAFQGSADDEVAALLDGFDVVPVAEWSPFAERSDGFAVLPITVRRAAALWERIGAELYRKNYPDADNADVFLTLQNGQVELWTTVGEGSAPAWVAPLIAAGTHRVELLDPAVAVATPLPLPVDAASLDAAAVRLVSDLSAAFEAARGDARPALPDASTGEDLWTRLENASDGTLPRRHWQRPDALPTVSVVERIRESLDEPPFETIDAIARQLRDLRGSGFEHAWRAGDAPPISPSWLTTRSAAVDPHSGRVVMAAHLTHEVCGLAPAHDLGAIDGRNRFTFTDAGHPGGIAWPIFTVYVGSVRAGTLVPLDATLSATSVDLHPNGDIAVLHHLGNSTSAVSLFSPSGTRRVLTTVEGISGAEAIRFSGDGAWLLISRTNDSVLVETATGRWTAVDVPNAGWWPGADSALLSIEHRDGQAIPTLFGLQTATTLASYPAVELDTRLLESYPYVWTPTVSPDGTEVLGVSPVGVTPEYQGTHGTGSRLVRFTLQTGRGTAQPAFIDADQKLEHDVSEPRWTTPAPAYTVNLHPDLLAALHEPVTAHEWLAPGRWASELEQMLVLTLNAAIDRTREGLPIADLLPEIVALLVPIAADPECWGNQSQWLLGLRDTTVDLAASGTITGALAASWRQYGAAIAAIEAGRPDLIDPIALAWAPAAES